MFQSKPLKPKDNKSNNNMSLLKKIGIALVCIFLLSKCGSDNNSTNKNATNGNNVKVERSNQIDGKQKSDVSVTKQDLDVFIPMAKHQKLNEQQLRKIVTVLKKLNIDYNRITGMHPNGGDYEIIEIGRSGISSRLDDSYEVIVNFGKYDDGTCKIIRVLFQTRPGPRYYGCHVLCSGESIKDNLDNYKFDDAKIKTLDQSLLNAIRSNHKNAQDLTLDSAKYKFYSSSDVELEINCSYSYKSDIYGDNGRIQKRGSAKIVAKNNEVSRVNSY